MEISLIFWNCLVAILAVALVCVLARFQRAGLLVLVIALSLFTMVHFGLSSDPDSIETMGFVKLMFLLPLGLGSVLIFSFLPEEKQRKALNWFTPYINFAVTANILIMIFTPDGDTYRGLLSRLVCLTLVAWLLLEMAKVRFQTTFYDQGFFLFRSSPLQWVIGHACYRMALLSLPAFDSLHYILLEPLSLITMVALYRMHDKRHPLSFYFGFADTLVVTTLAVLSRYPIPPPFDLKGPALGNISQSHLDMIFVPLQIAVVGFAAWCIYSKRGKVINKSKTHESLGS